MFISAKLLAFATQPLAWVALLWVGSLLLGRKHAAMRTRLGIGALLLLLVLGWEPLPDAALRQLESQSPALTRPDANLPDAVGVIVLGGALEPAYVWQTPGQSALNDAAERMTEVLPLLRRQPHLKVLFTGGEGELFANDMPEAARARKFFEGQGLDAQHMLYESASRTTFENAVLSQHLAGVDPKQPWLLLTSAWHMPRALAVFRATGWNVIAYPVDFRSGQSTPWTQFSMDQGAHKWHVVLHEWLGLLAYRLSGRI